MQVAEVNGANAPALKDAVSKHFPMPSAASQDLEDNPLFIARRERIKAQAKEM